MPIIDIKCSASKRFILFLILLGLSSVIIIFCLSIAWPFQFILTIITLLYVIDNIRIYGLLMGRHSIVHAQLLINKEWKLTTNQGIFLAKLHADSRSYLFGSILIFKIENKQFPLVSIILRGSLDKENDRKLLVHLRMKHDS